MQKLDCKCLSDESCLILRPMSCYSRPLGPLSYSKTCSKKHATCFATLLQSELNTNSNNAHYTTHVRICIAKIRSQGFLWMVNAQHRYSTRFAAMLQNKLQGFCCPFYHTFNFLCTSEYPTTFRSERLKLLYFHSLSCQ